MKELAERFTLLPVVFSALAKLRAELPPTLAYHTYDHTIDVFNEVLTFGSADGLSERELELLAIAAVLHDVGFIFQPAHNEPIAAQLAAEMLSAAGGYSPDEIALVERMILDTALQQTPTGRVQIPTTLLSRYLLDADVSNFGRPDFFEKGELQRKELALESSVFLAETRMLLRNHAWLTPAAQRLRSDQKARNVAALEDLIAQNG